MIQQGMTMPLMNEKEMINQKKGKSRYFFD